MYEAVKNSCFLLHTERTDALISSLPLSLCRCTECEKLKVSNRVMRTKKNINKILLGRVYIIFMYIGSFIVI